MFLCAIPYINYDLFTPNFWEIVPVLGLIEEFSTNSKHCGSFAFDMGLGIS